MNRLVKVYLVAGLAFLLSGYVILLSLWFEGTLNGLANGQYVVAVDTNALGESSLVLVMLFLFLPVAAWVFTGGLRRLLRTEDAI